MEIQNNVLNLPMRVEQSGTGTMGGTMTYTYLGDGTRAAARVGAAPSRYAGKRYRGSFVYDVSAAGVQRLESVAVSTGRLIALTGTNGAVSFESDGFITDHLGNVAAIVNLSASPATSTENAILEQNDYTPFGTKVQNASLKTQVANRWRYAGKEEQDIAGMNLHLLDFGARYYDTFTCRWNAVDPLASSNVSDTPYAYCTNNSVNVIDPDGCQWYRGINGELVYNEGDLSEEEVKSKGYTYVGNTYSTNDTYYSLYGEVISKSTMTEDGLYKWEIYHIADKAVIDYYTNPYDEDGNMQRYTVLLSNTKKKGVFYAISYGKSSGENSFSTSILNNATNAVQMSYYYACDEPNAFVRWFPTTRRANGAMGMKPAIGCTLTLENDKNAQVFQLTFSETDAQKMINCSNKIFVRKDKITDTPELKAYLKSNRK